MNIEAQIAIARLNPPSMWVCKILDNAERDNVKPTEILFGPFPNKALAERFGIEFIRARHKIAEIAAQQFNIETRKERFSYDIAQINCAWSPTYDVDEKLGNTNLHDIDENFNEDDFKNYFGE